MVVSESELSLLLRILKFKVIVVSREMRGGKPRCFFDKTMQYNVRKATTKKANFIIVHKRNERGVRVRHKNSNEITEGTM